VSEQTCGEMKNPSDLLRRVYDNIILTHIIISSPESKYENDDVMMFYSTFLKNMNANIAKN
jgi:hypothetical protein